MAALELELSVHDPLNPMFGGVLVATKDGEPVQRFTLSGNQYHYLLGAILREATDLTDGEGGR